jgi:hypothetical protein
VPSHDVNRCISLFALLASGPLSAAAQQPAAGTYTCYTFYISAQLQQRWRTRPLHMEQELAQVLAQQTTVVPAGLSVALDGRGRYRVTGTRAAGEYSFNNTTQRLTLEGEGAQLNFRKYFVTRGGTSVLQFYPKPDVFYQCELGTSVTRSAGATGGGATNGTGVPPQRNDLPPPTAADWTGRFEGVYDCGRGNTPLRLTLETNDMGKLIGEVHFGGGNGVPRGSYRVEGVRAGTVFTLTALRWIERADGYMLTDLEGRLTGGTINGRLRADGCSAMVLTKR